MREGFCLGGFIERQALQRSAAQRSAVQRRGEERRQGQQKQSSHSFDRQSFGWQILTHVTHPNPKAKTPSNLAIKTCFQNFISTLKKNTQKSIIITLIIIPSYHEGEKEKRKKKSLTLSWNKIQTGRYSYSILHNDKPWLPLYFPWANGIMPLPPHPNHHILSLALHHAFPNCFPLFFFVWPQCIWANEWMHSHGGRRGDRQAFGLQALFPALPCAVNYGCLRSIVNLW